MRNAIDVHNNQYSNTISRVFRAPTGMVEVESTRIWQTLELQILKLLRKGWFVFFILFFH